MLERLAELDVQAFRAIHHALWGTAWMPLLLLVQRAGEGAGLVALALFILLVAPRGRRAAFILRVALPVLLAFLAAELLKNLTRLERPRTLVPELVLNRDERLAKHYSWPSGHTAAVFAFATAVLHLRLSEVRLFTGATALAFGVAATTGLARIAVAAHFPADVLGGALLGVSVAQLATLALARSRPPLVP